MGWSGGTFTRVHDWTDDEAGGIDILSTRFDEEDDNFETGINACLTKDGSNSPSANLPMGGMRHTGASDGVDRSDYATVGQVQDSKFRYGRITGSLNEFRLTVTPTPAGYVDGQQFTFFADRENSGSTRLNVNSLGFKDVYSNGSPCTGGEIVLNRVYTVVYDAGKGKFNLLSGGGSGGGISLGGAKIVMSSHHTVGHYGFEVLPLNTLIYNDGTDPYYYNGSIPGFKIPVDGRYRISASIIIENRTASVDAQYYLQAGFALNGTVRNGMQSTLNTSSWIALLALDQRLQLMWEGSLEKDDQIKLTVFQVAYNSTSASIYGNGTEMDSTWMAIERIY